MAATTSRFSPPQRKVEKRQIPSKPMPRFVGVLRQMAHMWWVYAILLPLFILLGIFSYYPAISGFYFSFFDWRPGFDSPFVGLANYRAMLQDHVFWQSFIHIGWIFVFGVTVAWILPLLAAEWMISLKSSRWQYFFRTGLIIPLAFPIVVQVLLWNFLYDPNVGLINTTLRSIGLGSLAHNWLGDPRFALLAMMGINAPYIASVPFLLFLSALQNIPSEIYAAAELDGAGRWRRFLFIDFPLLATQFRLLFLLAIIQILQYAVPVALLTNGSPNYATEVPILRILDTAFSFDEWGLAAAYSSTLFLIILGLSLVVQQIQRPRRTPAVAR